MWRQYFKLINIIPGRVHFARHGMIDFRKDDLDPYVLKHIMDDGSPYLELTREGEQFFHPPNDTRTKPTTKRKLAE